ncbi:hypothetical protein Q3G72_007176 [Acer saccharum]|nr:hypothetical protein Q3G72_007176 [Acer saccharum]
MKRKSRNRKSWCWRLEWYCAMRLWVQHGYTDICVQGDSQLVSKQSCTIEFDGASKGNPGRSGAGVVLRDDSGKEVMRAREGLGSTTNNAAEYRALIRGMKTALDHGYTDVRVQGDSQLVSNQVNGKWKVKSPNLTQLYKDATELKGQFQGFKMDHVPREYNSEADAQANRGVYLRDGQVEKEYIYSNDSEYGIYSGYDSSESE